MAKRRSMGSANNGKRFTQSYPGFGRSNMFNLDEAIADWRRQMAAGGVKNPEILDELESHLREDVEEQMGAGSNTQQAFERAVQGIGQVATLECEFGKVGGIKKAQARVKQAMRSEER